MLYCPNFFWNVLQVWMTGKDVYLQMTWSWPDKTWNILCSYCLQWNTSQSKFRNHYFLFLLAFSILSQLFLIWGCIYLNNWKSSQVHVCWISFPITGYSVTSAKVKPSKTLYISGAPRYNLTGGVFIFNGSEKYVLQGDQVFVANTVDINTPDCLL